MKGTWNELPEEVVVAGTIIAFKIHYDRYMNRKVLEGYGPKVGRWTILDGMEDLG